MRGRRRFLYVFLATAAALVLIPSAASNNGDALVLGSQTNTATASTFLTTTGQAGLAIVDSTISATALQGKATALSGPGWGVLGESDSGSADSVGVYGHLIAFSPIASSGVSTTAAVRGISTSGNAYGPGVYGLHMQSSGSSPGVMGETSSTVANASGVYGKINSSADYSGGVRGENFNTACCGFGVVGFHSGQGIGIGGYAPNGFGVFGWSPNNWAGYFDGAVEVVHDLHVNGTLFKAGGAFRIDNPLDPAHSYLQHSFVESPDMKNIYDGVAKTNAQGYATVQLPKWFQALNKDFRYQLTVMGRSFAQAIVWKEIAHNRFTIKTNQPNVKVSWQVTGIRHDPYANAHRIQLVVPKTGSDAGKYAHPRLYGQPAGKGVAALPAALKYSKQAAAPKAKTK
jgi:hypothetical protein